MIFTYQAETHTVTWVPRAPVTENPAVGSSSLRHAEIRLAKSPLMPTGTYLVERKRQFLSNQMTVLERRPLDWEQVLKVWVVAFATPLAVIWVFKFLPRLLFRGRTLHVVTRHCMTAFWCSCC
jgi:hypothetical protein